MRRRHDRFGACLVAACAAAYFSPVAPAQQPGFSLGVAVEQTTGDYGGLQDLTDTYVPVTLRYDMGRTALRLTVPWLEIEFADAGTPDGLPVYTETGLGDVIAGLTVYDVIRSASGSLAVDLTGKAKLPTADDDRGLGTGETDYSLEAEVYRFLGRGTLVGTFGYRVRGEPDAFDLENSWLASVGALYRVSSRASLGIFADFRESAIPGADPVRELTLQLSSRLDRPWQVRGYLIRGLSDTALDWGAGLSFGYDP